MIPEQAVRAASAAMNCRWMPRSGRHPDCELCLNAARLALEADAPFIRAQALEDAAAELDKLWYERKDRPAHGARDWADGVEEAEAVLRARAVTERGGE